MNLKHLRYVWMTARAGSVAKAAQQLHLTPQTVSAQIKLFEEELGVALFRPAGRGIELTDAGAIALTYADEIFALGDELTAALQAHTQQALPAFRVGVTDVVSKSLALRLLTPLNALANPVRLICREGQMDTLLADLALHRLEVLVADRPMPSGLAIRGHNHKLGESPIAFFAAPALAARCGQGVKFPECLNGQPLLLPSPSTAVRAEIDRWLTASRVLVQIAGEFDDSALMEAFAQAGSGFFPAPAILSQEICRQNGVQEVGRVNSVREAFWLISTERHIKHPAVLAILDGARKAMVGG